MSCDLLFAARRDSLGNRIVFQFAHDVFDNWFEQAKGMSFRRSFAIASLGDSSCPSSSNTNSKK